MAALDLKDLKLFETALDDVADKFKDIGDDAKDGSKEVEEFEKRIASLIIKANPLPRLVKDINDQLSRQADQMRQTTKAVDELARAYDRLDKAQRGLPGGMKPGPKFGSAAKPPIDKSPMDPPEPPAPDIPRERSKKSVAGGLTSSESEALGGSTIEAITSIAKGDEPLKVLIDLSEDLAKTFLKASLEGVSLGTELKRMGVSTGILKVVGGDAKAAQAGLALMTGATGELTAATVGMGEAATAAGAAEMVAFTPVGLVLGGIALAVGAVAAVFAVTAQQIGKSTGENLDHLKLTEEQLARVKDKGVTMGDVLSGVWKTTTDMLQQAFGPALKWLGDLFGKIYQGVVDGVLWVVKSSVQAIGGFIGGFKAAFGGLGPAVGDLVISGLNIAGEAVLALVNKAIEAINRLVSMGNGAAEKMGLSIRLPELKQISIASIKNPFEGKAAAFGKDIYKGVTDGADGAGKALDALGDRMVKNIVKARDTRVVEKAGKAVKDAADAACGCGSNLQNVANDNRSYRWGGAQREQNAATGSDDATGRFNMTVTSVSGTHSLEDDLIAEKLPDPGKLNVVPQIDAQNILLSTMISHFEKLNALAPALGDSLEKAFGGPGKALSDVISAAATLGKKLGEISLEERDPKNKDQAVKFARERVNASVSGFAEMSIAAQGFFDKNSSGYAALQSVEKAYRAWQFAQQVQAMAREAADTIRSITNSMAKGAASTAAGAAKMFEMLGPFAFPAVAAMVALLAGFGLSGGAGGGAVPGVDDMKNRQANQGSGSIPGDPNAKSESLEKALTHARGYENKDLEYGNAMVRSLKSIDDQIGAVASALARSFGAGGMLSTEDLALGKTGTAATLSNLGFGKSTTRTLQDQGLQFDATTLGAIVGGGGLSGSTYQQVLENTKKKAFGITTSNKSKVITETGALDPEFLVQVTGLIELLGKGVGDAAKAIGSTDFEALLTNFKVDLGKLSFKDMTGTQIEEALNAIFGKLGDDMAKTAVPAIATFQKVGEGAFETLVRVARQYEVIDTTLKSVGMKFGDIGVSSLAARERLVDLAGGLDTLTDQASFFAEHFLSEGERLDPVQTSVKDELTRLKLPTTLTRDEFKDKVKGLNLSTKEDAELYVALMDLAPAFDKVATAAEKAKADIEAHDNGVKEKATSIHDQIDELVMTPSQKLAKSRDAEKTAVEKLDASLLPLLKSLWDLQDAADKTAEATAKAAEAQALAKSQSNMYADLLEAQGRTDEATTLRRQLAYGEIKDPQQQTYQLQIWAAQDAAAEVTKAREVLNQAYQKERDELVQTKDKFQELSDALKAFSASLSDTIIGADSATRYRTTRGRFLDTAALARGGDEDAMRQLQANGEAFTAASRDYASSTVDYLRDVGLVRAAVDGAADTADRQKSIAEQQLEALKLSVEGLIDINGSVISVEKAILALKAANSRALDAGVVSVGGVVIPGAQPGGGTNTGQPTTPPALNNRTADGLYYYDPMIGVAAYYESQRDPQYWAHGNPYEQPGTQEYSVLQTLKTKDPAKYYELTYMDNIHNFATGGSFEVGGSGPPDSKLFNLALSPGEAVNVQRADQKNDRALITELRSLRAELADLRASSARIANSNDKMERTLTNVTEGGRAMQTQAAA